MQIFLDSVDINEIKHVLELGLLDGITTNPSLVSTIKKDANTIIKDICDMVDCDVSIEVTSEDYDGIIRQGENILNIAKNVVIKLPSSIEGIKACKYFSQNNVKTNMTLCFSVNQALIVAKVGASYVSPFVGRSEDIGFDGSKLIYDIKQVYNNYSFNTKVLAASIRNPWHFQNVALAGSDIVTMSYKVFMELFKNPLTSIGQEKFSRDAKNSTLII